MASGVTFLETTEYVQVNYWCPHRSVVGKFFREDEPHSIRPDSVIGRCYHEQDCVFTRADLVVTPFGASWAPFAPAK